MASIYEIAAFDIGWAPKFGSIVNIQKNDTINNFTMNFAHLPLSTNVDFGVKISSSRGRTVRGAIWICRDGWSLNNEPDFKSVNTINTNDLRTQTSLSSFDWTSVRFDFQDAGPIYADKIVLGVVTNNSDYDDTKTSAICYQKNYGSTLYYMRDLLSYVPEAQMQNTNGINFSNISVTHYYEYDPETPEESNVPPLQISKISYRTLSVSRMIGNEPYPLPSADDTVIKSSESDLEDVQWNTAIPGHPYVENGGFDIPEGALKDVVLFDGTMDRNNAALFNSPGHPYWTHARSRIMFVFPSWTGGSSKIRYTIKVAQQPQSSAEHGEISAVHTTLVICPRDEGVEDNTSWSIEFVRYSYDSRGNALAESVPLVLEFNTFVTPQVHIAYPKPLRNKLFHETNTWDTTEYNYVLWANDVVNNQDPDNESRDTKDQICDALNLLLTKDGGDNSHFPVFTRVYVAEIEGHYTGNSTSGYEFNTPSNSDIENNASNVRTLAFWTGALLDDGALVQLSGIQNQGFNWDHVIEEDGWQVNGQTINPNIEFPLRSEYKPPYHAAWVTSTEDENGNPFVYDEQNPDPLMYVSGSTVYKMGYAVDKRMCFRAGRKYLIRVRRFHSAAAGAINSPQYNAEPWRYQGFPTGGNYDYSVHPDYGGAPIEDPTNTQYYIKSNAFPYYTDTSNAGIVSWLDKNNRGVYAQQDGTPLRWVGVYDGASGHTLTEEAINTVYPGESTVDYVILDCLNTIYTNQDIITPRPSIQEFNANGWVTFAYRHLSKNMTGIDFWHKANSATVPGGVGTLSGQFAEDGSPLPNTAQRPYYGSTWGGVDNTGTRIYNMYKYLIAYIIHTMNPSVGNWEDRIIRPGNVCRYQLHSSRLRIYLDKEGFHNNDPEIEGQNTEVSYRELYGSTFLQKVSDDGQSVEDLDETINPFDKIILYQDPNFEVTDGEMKDDCLMGFMKDPNNITVGANGMEIFYDRWGNNSDTSESSLKYPAYGNTYKWVPIINATNQNGNNHIPIKHPVQPYYQRNYHDLEYGGAEGHDSTFLCTQFYTPDTTHGVIDVNTHQPELSNRTNDFPTNANPVKEYSGTRTNPGVSTQKNLFVTQGSGQLSEIITYPNYGTTANPKGVQYFNLDGIQCSTGELYKRVPLSQDCENGVPTSNRLVTPLSKIKWPLVRSTHMLYFTTYTFGNLKYEWYWVAYYGTEVEQDGATVCSNPHYHIENYGENGVTSVIQAKQHESFQNLGIGTVETRNGGTYHNILQVYGEDNEGAGRLLSADNDATAWYNGQGVAYPINNVYNPQLDGGIEIPLRVRYTPLLQPINTLDPKIIKNIDPLATQNTNNIISVITAPEECGGPLTTREWNSRNVQDSMKYKEQFYIYLSYGMLLSTSKGRYVSRYVNDSGSGRRDYHYVVQSGKYFNETFPNGTSPYYHKIVSPSPQDYAVSTDCYPAVGICNSYLILLIPTDAKDANGNSYDYTRQIPNWFADRNNYEGITSSTNSIAKTVIVADLAFTDGESVRLSNDMITDEDPIVYSIQHPDEFSTEQLDHQFRTLYKCEFNYHRLIYSNNLNPDSGCEESESQHQNKLVANTWYDLVAVPIYSNHAHRNNTNGTDETATFYHYTDGAGYLEDSERNVQYKYGGGESDDPKGDPNKFIDYYGSTPLVIRKFLKIDKISTSDNAIDDEGNEEICNVPTPPGPGPGGDPDPGPSYDPSIYEWTLPVIMYPNVNNYRFSVGKDSAYIHECPGFWLNNTFRVIMRGPHFRPQADIDANPSNETEISVEEATGGVLSGTEGSQQFRISDIQVHIGKYTDVCRDGSGNIIDNRVFNSTEYQDDIIQHSMDKTWLNAHNIYSMRFNDNAFSKCVPLAKQRGDKRDIVLGGDLTDAGPQYKNRFFEFCPHLVNAETPYPEGYYIQFRYLNNEYSDTTSGDGWSTWFGGLIKDNVRDTALNYYVPIRNYNDIYTTFRSFIKESYPGSAITSKVDNTITNTDESIEEIVGAGSQSPRNLMGTLPIPGFEVPAGNPVETPVVPSTDVPAYDENGVEFTNSDFPYFAQIWDEFLNTHNSEAYRDRFPIDSEIDENHRRYWEMTYIDYIISNMLKLYYSEWSGAYINADLNIEPKDFGWTQALKDAYSKTSYWSVQQVDTGAITTASRANTTKISNADPANRNKYFRKPIVYKDFTNLIDALKALVTFIRDEQFTGTHTTENDLVDSTGKSTGSKVIMLDPDNLNIDIQTKGIIGHDADYHHDTDQKYTLPVDTNYLRNVFDTIITKIIKTD